jgi:microcystin-dependent protein
MPLNPYLGQIMPAGFGIIPKGWAPCNGALFAISTNQALFSLLGTAYGGDGIRTFALPDLRGRAVLGSNLTSVPWGQVSGTETATVSTAQLPNHNHVVQATTKAGDARAALPTNNLFAQNTAPAGEYIFELAGSMEISLSIGTNIINTGGGLPHNNMQPSLVVNYMIATSGIYPPRP